MTLPPPPEGTDARWAYDYVVTDSLAHKLSPPPVPRAQHAGAPLRLAAPGRPPALRVSWQKYKAPKSAAALRDPAKRAHLLHTFFHHELQAAELMCWALLAFPEAPAALRHGLLGICLDEVRHMGLYAAHVQKLGFTVGAFPVRDWFWQRAPAAERVGAFLALMSLGFEAGNLDHSARSSPFREAGDDDAAAVQAQVGREESARRLRRTGLRASGPLAFAAGSRAAAAALADGHAGPPLARAARSVCGFDARFLEELEHGNPDRLLLNLARARAGRSPADACSPALRIALAGYHAHGQPAPRRRPRDRHRRRPRGCTVALAFCPTPRALARIRAAASSARRPPLAVLAR